MRTKKLGLAPLAAAILMTTGSGWAVAGEVQFYGLIETGLNYVNIDADNGQGSSSAFEQRAGQFIPSRWGLRGREDLGNGWSAGFNLEGQFAADTGAMTGDRLFHRTAQVSLSGPYGEILMGRSGLLRSGFGTTGLWGTKVNPFSSSVGRYVAGSKYVFPGDFKAADNTVTYRSSVMSGWQLHAQYSGKIDAVNDQTNEEFSGESDRVWGIGMTYLNGPLHLAAVFDSIRYGNGAGNAARDFGNSAAFSLAAVYDFGVLKLYTSGMWFDGMWGKKFQGHDFDEQSSIFTAATYTGYAVQTGADIPAWGGTVKLNLGWMDAKADEVSGGAKVSDTDRLAFSAGYVYPLSKRTNVYWAGGFVRDTSNVKDYSGTHPRAYETMIGMWHRF